MNIEEQKAIEEMESIIVAFGPTRALELFELAKLKALCEVPAFDDLKKGYRKI